jgi:Fur family transcriptional regulator, ferric uptake regulator
MKEDLRLPNSPAAQSASVPCDDPRPHHHHTPVADEWLASVTEALRASGQRTTVPRRAILHWIAGAAAPFGAETLVRELEAQHGISSRATVYRLLDWLRSEGWLERVHRDGAQSTYARLLPGHHHHAVCTQCGSVLVVGGCDIDQSFAAALRGSAFEIHGHMLEIYGLCGRCRAYGGA